MPGLPALTDGVVVLRAHRGDDVDDMVAMGADPEMARWTSVPRPFGPADARMWVHETAPGGWRDGSAYRWAVEHASRFAGNVDLRVRGVPDLGFATAPWARGRGLTARAVRLAARWGFVEAGLPVLHWSAHAGHLASWRVAHACGFTFDGRRPLALEARGELYDGWFASLRPGDELTPRTTWLPCPVLGGARVRLRPHTDSDVARIVEACSDPRTRRFQVSLPHPYTDVTAREFVGTCRLDESLGRAVTWAIADTADDRLLGNIAAFGLVDPFDPTGAKIGFWAHPDARGRGAVGEALDLAATHAFDLAGLGRHRLEIGAAWSNSASRHVAERAGFTLVGRHRLDNVVGHGAERTVEDGAWYDRLAPRLRGSAPVVDLDGG